MKKAMRLLNILLLPAIIYSAPLDIEGERDLQDQQSQNAIPRLGKRSYNLRSNLLLPSFTSGIIPSFPQFLFPKIKSTGSKRKANFLSSRYPAFPKRSAVADDWSSIWSNVLRSPQGFRLYDGGNNYLSNAVMYKRGQDFTSELNSVPLLGKRQPELSTSAPAEDSAPTPTRDGNDHEDNFWSSAVDADPDFWDLFPEDNNNIMADASLYPPVLGPHYRTILTRVQRSPEVEFAAGE